MKHDASRATILRWLSTQHEGRSRGAIILALDMTPRDVSTCLQSLTSRGHVERCGGSGNKSLLRITEAGMAALVTGTQTRAERRRLPLAPGFLVQGHGERRDCARYDDCIDAFLATFRHGEPNGHCPTQCRWHVEPMRESATDYTSSGYSNYDAHIFAGGS